MVTEVTDENIKHIWIRFDDTSMAWEVNQQESAEDTETRWKEDDDVYDGQAVCVIGQDGGRRDCPHHTVHEE